MWKAWNSVGPHRELAAQKLLERIDLGLAAQPAAWHDQPDFARGLVNC
jgi:hypothetical protein